MRPISILLLTITLCFSQTVPQSASSSQGRGFPSPEAAADALVQAATSYDLPALLDILGPGGRDLVASDDAVQDKIRASAFVALAREKAAVNRISPIRAEMTVGNDNWPLPIPIVQRSKKWYFDTKAGRQEILLRRIGENELTAIQICRGYVEAQLEYASQKHDGSLVNQYAQQIISTAGRQNGLAWQNPDGTWAGPVGEAAARALQEGFRQGQPYHGYYFKVLKGQGSGARNGAIDFLVNGVMIGGFALVAAPAEHRVTGVKTFIVNQDGIVYEKDLGPDTLSTFKSMELYNPDKTWLATDVND
jgi:hypothetical protein